VIDLATRVCFQRVTCKAQVRCGILVVFSGTVIICVLRGKAMRAKDIAEGIFKQGEEH
jgi:hypothetical protein